MPKQVARLAAKQKLLALLARHGVPVLQKHAHANEEYLPASCVASRMFGTCRGGKHCATLLRQKPCRCRRRTH
eukprot:3104643-Alexandrium_andersonii.AAC.1